MAADTSFSNTLHTLGFIEAITRFDGSSSVKRKIEPSTDDYVGKITALFLPYVSDQISERDFSAVQFKLKKIVSDMKKGYAK